METPVFRKCAFAKNYDSATTQDSEKDKNAQDELKLLHPPGSRRYGGNLRSARFLRSAERSL